MPELEQWPTGRLLSTAARLVEQAWNEQLTEIGLTHAGFTVLGVLKTRGPLTQIAIAHIVRVQAQTMGKTVGRLEAYGYVSRSRSELDRRIQVVSISLAGADAYSRAERIEDTMVRQGTLSSEAFRDNLQSLIENLKVAP